MVVMTLMMVIIIVIIIIIIIQSVESLLTSSMFEVTGLALLLYGIY
jgi:hypothetical protein